MTGDRVARLKARALDESKKLLGIFAYLWVVLTLFSLHKAFVFNEDMLTYQQGFALVNALALAKIMLLGEKFDIGGRFRERAPIYSILFKSLAFAAILLCFHVVEETVIGLARGRTLSESVPTLGDGTLQAILMVAIILFVTLIPFFAYMELERVIGAEKLRALLFKRAA